MSVLLSIIVPTLNRAKLVGDLLDSLGRQEDVPFSWEVIIVDNASADNTAKVVRRKQAELSVCIRYALESHPGLHAGRHRGAREARGEYLAYLDNDMTLAPSWLQGVAMLREGRADAVVGRILPKWEHTPPDWLTRMVKGGILGPLGILDLGERRTPTDCLFGGNLFIPRRTVFDLRGFNPDGMPQGLVHFRGDGESGLWRKMKAHRMTLWYEPEALAYHIIPQERMTVKYMRNRGYRQGISKTYSTIRQYGGVDLRVATVLKLVMLKSLFAAVPLNPGRRALLHGYVKGIFWHFHHCQGNPDTVAWILQRDYMNPEEF